MCRLQLTKLRSGYCRSRLQLTAAIVASAVLAASLAGGSHDRMSAFTAATATGRAATHRPNLRASSRLLRYCGKEDQDAVAPPLQLWLDLRQAKEVKISGVRVASGGLQELEGTANARKILVGLVSEVRAKFEKLNMTTPKGQFITAVLVNPADVELAYASFKDLKLKIFFHVLKFKGAALPVPDARFICDAETQMPIGAVPPPPVQFAAFRKPYAANIWLFDPLAELAAAEERENDKAEATQRYKEGLSGEKSYVMPPKARAAELLGYTAYVDRESKLTEGGIFAKALPADPILWARELLAKSKAQGGSAPSVAVGTQ